MNKTLLANQRKTREARKKALDECPRRKDGTIVCPPKRCYGSFLDLSPDEKYEGYDR